MTSALLKDLNRYQKEGGPLNEDQLNFALHQFVQKYKKFEAGKAKDKLLQDLYNEDPTRLHTFYNLRDKYDEYDAQHKRIIEGKGDIDFYLADGSGAGLEYPEKILPGEEPIYRMNQRNRKGQDLIGKYVRDKNGRRKAVYFSDEAVRILNEQNYMNR